MTSQVPEATGVEVPVILSVWRTDAAGGHEEPVTIPGIKVGTQIVPVGLTVWRDLTPPPPPGDVPLRPEVNTFAATTVTGSSFQLYWSSPGAPADHPILGYYVMIDGALAHDVGPEGAVVTDLVYDEIGRRMTVFVSGFAAGEVHQVTIIAYNDIGASEASLPFTVQTGEQPPADQAPNAPTNFRVTSVGSTIANVAWSAATVPSGGSAVTNYRIYNGGTVLLDEVGNVTNTQLVGLQPGTDYRLTVRAVNVAGESLSSSIVPLRTVSDIPNPTAPANLRVTASGDGFVSLAWAANAGVELVDGYQVYRGTTLVTSTTNTSFSVTGLTNGQTYTFTVRAYRGQLVSAASAPVQGTPQGTVTPQLPTAPAGLSVVNEGNTQVQLDWADNPATQGVTSYRVVQNGVTLSTVITTSGHTVTGLTNNQLYTFAVRAVNPQGTGPASANVTATPRSGVVVVSSLPFSADSFYKSRVDGPNVPIDQARTTAFRNFMDTFRGTNDSPSKQAEVKHPRLNIDPQWAMTYHISKSSDPIWKIREGISPRTGQRVSPFGAEFNVVHANRAGSQGFHLADAKVATFPSGDQDRPCIIIDHPHGYSVQFADSVAFPTQRVIECTGPGILWHTSNGLDKRNPRGNDQRNFTSRGRIVNAMIITREDLDRAVANNTGVGHMLHLFHCETRTTDGFCHPMINAEDGKNGWGIEGERVRVSPTVNLVQRGLTGHALAVARTLQQHGGILGDNSGSVTLVKMSQPQFYTGTNITTDAFAGKLFWRDFEVVQKGWQ